MPKDVKTANKDNNEIEKIANVVGEIRQTQIMQDSSPLPSPELLEKYSKFKTKDGESYSDVIVDCIKSFTRSNEKVSEGIYFSSLAEKINKQSNKLRTIFDGISNIIKYITLLITSILGFNYGFGEWVLALIAIAGAVIEARKYFLNKKDK